MCFMFIESWLVGVFILCSCSKVALLDHGIVGLSVCLFVFAFLSCLGLGSSWFVGVCVKPSSCSTSAGRTPLTEFVHIIHIVMV